MAPTIEVFEDSYSNGIGFKHGLLRSLDFELIAKEFTKFVLSSGEGVQAWDLCAGSTSLSDDKGYTFRIPLKDSVEVKSRDIIDIEQYLCDEGAFVFSDIYCNCYGKDAILPIGVYLPNSYSSWFQHSMKCTVNLSFDYTTKSVSFSRSERYSEIFGKSPCYMLVSDHHGVLNDDEALSNAFELCNAVSMLKERLNCTADGYSFTSYRPSVGRLPDFIKLVENNKHLPSTFPIVVEVGCTGSNGHLNFDYLYTDAGSTVLSDNDKLNIWHSLLSLGREVYLGLVPLDNSFVLSDFDKSVLALVGTYSNLHIVNYDVSKLSFPKVVSNQSLFDKCCDIYSIDDYSVIGDYVSVVCSKKSYLYEDITRRYAELFFPYELHKPSSNVGFFSDLFVGSKPSSPQYDYLLTGFAYSNTINGESTYSMQDYFQVQFNRHVPPSVVGSPWLAYSASSSLYSSIASNISNLVSDGVKNVVVCMNSAFDSSSVSSLNAFDSVLASNGIRLIVLFAFHGGGSILGNQDLHDSYHKYWLQLSCAPDRIIDVPELIRSSVFNRFLGTYPKLYDFFSSMPTYLVKNFFITDVEQTGLSRIGSSASGAINVLLYDLYNKEYVVNTRKDTISKYSPCYYLTIDKINSSNLFDFKTFTMNRPPQVIRNTGEALTFNLHTLYDEELPSYEQGGGVCKDLFEFDIEGGGKTANLLNWLKSIPHKDYIELDHGGCYTYPARNTGCSWFTYSDKDKDIYDSIEFFFIKNNYGGTVTLLFFNSINSSVVPVWQTISFGLVDVFDDAHKLPLFIAGGTTGLSPDSYTYSYSIPESPPTVVTVTVVGNSYNFNARQLSCQFSNLLYPALLSGCSISNFAVLSEDGVWKYAGNFVQAMLSKRGGTVSEINDGSNFFVLPTASNNFNYLGALGGGNYYEAKDMLPVHLFHGSLPNMEERGIIGSIPNHFAVRTDAHLGIVVVDNKRYLIIPNGWYDRLPYVVSGADDESVFRDLDNANKFLFKYNLAIYIGDVADNE